MTTETTEESKLKRHTNREDWWGTFVALWDIAENGYVVGSPGKETENMEGAVVVYSVYDGIRLMLASGVSYGYSYQVKRFLDENEDSEIAYIKSDEEKIRQFQGDVSTFVNGYKWCSDNQKFGAFEEFYWAKVFPLLVSAEINGVDDIAHRAYAMRGIPEDYQEEFYGKLGEQL